MIKYIIFKPKYIHLFTCVYIWDVFKFVFKCVRWLLILRDRVLISSWICSGSPGQLRPDITDCRVTENSLGWFITLTLNSFLVLSTSSISYLFLSLSLSIIFPFTHLHTSYFIFIYTKKKAIKLIYNIKQS